MIELLNSIWLCDYLIYKYLHSNASKNIIIMPFKYLFCVLIICEISCWAIMTLSIDCTVNITAKRIFLSNAQFKSKSHKNSCNWNIDSVSNQLLCTGSLVNHLKRNKRRHTNRFQLFIYHVYYALFVHIEVNAITCIYISIYYYKHCKLMQFYCKTMMHTSSLHNRKGTIFFFQHANNQRLNYSRFTWRNISR